jgi:hypothetical protein
VLPAPCAIRVARTKRPPGRARAPLIKTRDEPRAGERPGGSVSQFRQTATPWMRPGRAVRDSPSPYYLSPSPYYLITCRPLLITWRGRRSGSAQQFGVLAPGQAAERLRVCDAAVGEDSAGFNGADLR